MDFNRRTVLYAGGATLLLSGSLQNSVAQDIGNEKHKEKVYLNLLQLFQNPTIYEFSDIRLTPELIGGEYVDAFAFLSDTIQMSGEYHTRGSSILLITRELVATSPVKIVTTPKKTHIDFPSSARALSGLSPGKDGADGQDGGNADSSGSVLVIAEKINGKFDFVTTGLNGGAGEAGGNGAKGRTGKARKKECKDGRTGGKGGNGGIGGNGGHGGDAGDAYIMFGLETESSFQSAMIDSTGGERGIGGTFGGPGQKGDGGAGGPARRFDGHGGKHG